ncbi:O-antigen ligase family protein [Actinotalea sp. BY-33]|uniref:O-antigen ligase family protein n=1 Tax=Actinotalea soli TaxID=2819234 RepID=A0A939RSN5_9CELL|nr:O-antigen ligase family protein [Actinotalea soli]MBO1751987.1 O-antigen ligase family protein [Actinotalea soli]
MSSPVDPPQRLLRDPLLVVHLVLILSLAIPGRLIVEPLGALGAPATILTIGAVALYVIARMIPGYLADGYQPMRVPLILFWVVMLVSYGAGKVQVLSVLETNASDRALIVQTGYVALALLVADGTRTRRDLDRLLRLVVVMASALAVYGIVQFVTDIAPDMYIHVPGLTLQAAEVSAERSIFTRVQGTALHPIEFGVVLAIALPVALHYMLHGTADGRRSHWWKVAVVTMVVASPMAVSRSSVLGIGVGVGVLALTWTNRQRLIGAVAGMVLLVAMRSTFPGLLGTLRAMFVFAGDDPSIEGRTQDFPRVMAFFQENPWLGRGLGTLVPAEHFFLDNQYLGELITGGLVALAMLIALFLAAIGVGRGVFHHAQGPDARALGQALVAASAVSLVTWVTYDGMGFRTNAALAFIVFGATGALWRLEVGRRHWGRGLNKRPPAVERPEPGPVETRTAQTTAGQVAEPAALGGPS